MKLVLTAFIFLLALCSCTTLEPSSPVTPATESNPPPAPLPLASGVMTEYFAPAIRVQDDLFDHVNAGWLESTAIPADRASWGVFLKLRDDTQRELLEIIEALPRESQLSTDRDAQKIVDLYHAFMDEARLEQLGLSPLRERLARVDALKSKKEIAALVAELDKIGVGSPYGLFVNQDARDSRAYAVYLQQSGLGLPDRDYYLNRDDVKLKHVRDEYAQYIERMFALAGNKTATRDARAIVALETSLAKAQWTRVQNRDPEKTYNKVALRKLHDLAPDYDWKSYLTAAEIDGKADAVIVRQPSYLRDLNGILKKTPLPVWKAYFKWQLLNWAAPYSEKRLVDANFAFYGTVVRGIPDIRPRWRRGVEVVDAAIGEGLGRLYVANHFPPESKARMTTLVANLLNAYRQSIDALDWMSPQTKAEAQAKLAKFGTKIGYPERWRDYSKLVIVKDDLLGNLAWAATFEYERNMAKLGKPVDRGEWSMNPQTVNAYYSQNKNEVVFPAAILQPPFFNPNADDAVNYGAIGAVIGHEISHGFDDRGSQYDGDGNLRNWWTEEDRKRFSAKTQALVDQYSAYSPLPGYHINGELTLGENIADNAGLAIAYKAYQLSLAGKPAPALIDFTGNQRFYLGWAQAWRQKTRDAEIIRLLKIDPHSPSRFRANGAASNQPGFYEAFNVKPGDRMYLPPDKRVIIW